MFKKIMKWYVLIPLLFILFAVWYVFIRYANYANKDWVYQKFLGRHASTDEQHTLDIYPATLWKLITVALNSQERASYLASKG